MPLSFTHYFDSFSCSFLSYALEYALIHFPGTRSAFLHLANKVLSIHPPESPFCRYMKVVFCYYERIKRP